MKTKEAQLWNDVIGLHSLVQFNLALSITYLDDSIRAIHDCMVYLALCGYYLKEEGCLVNESVKPEL